MIKFQPGDLVIRNHHNAWWKETCDTTHLDPNGVFVVKECNKDTIVCEGWKFAADPNYFILDSRMTKEEIIAARIKKLYAKCKTTAHWV